MLVRSTVRKMKKNHFKRTVKIAHEVSDMANTSISASTIRRALHVNGPINQEKLLDYAKTKTHNILLSDESKFKISRTKNKKYVDQNLLGNGVGMYDTKRSRKFAFY